MVWSRGIVATPSGEDRPGCDGWVVSPHVQEHVREALLAERGADYAIDARYCDWFGRNVTWNVNGFLRRIK
ncbi:MAG TPA: hypothetical protein VLX09_00970 [Stellaceae bacterium]|nr:hypothetical protein [Stellaceae bacterium]